MRELDGGIHMHYKYEFEIDGKTVDANDPELSKIITGMWIRLYRIYKNNPQIFEEEKQ